MKKKYRQLILIGVAGILFFFMLSMFFPFLMLLSKTGALLVYAGVSATQILMMRNNHEDVGNAIKFTIAVIVIMSYLLFFF